MSLLRKGTVNSGNDNQTYGDESDDRRIFSTINPLLPEFFSSFFGT